MNATATKTAEPTWKVAYLLSSGNVAVLAGCPSYDDERLAVAEAARRNREKPFLAHLAIRSVGPLFAAA